MKIVNPDDWISMVNIAWFGKYGHGEGRHIHGWPADINWQELEDDLQRCRDNRVKVIRAFIFENLDGLEKKDNFWQISEEALANLHRIKELFIENELQLEAALFEFKNEEAQPFLDDFMAAEPFKNVIADFVREMRDILWAIDLHNEIDYLHLRREKSLAELAEVIAKFRPMVKSADETLLYTCSTGWRGGYWAKNGQIGLEHLDFIEIHHYTQHHGDPWERMRDESLHKLWKLDKPVLIGEYNSEDFDVYSEKALKKGFLGAAPWSIRHDFPITDATWRRINEFEPADIV